MKIRVYIVEDMAMTRIALIRKLKDEEFEVVGSAANAEKAWADMQNMPIDLVLLDINLAGEKDGIWLAQQIRQQLKIAIVFLTAFGDKAILDKVESINPNGFLMKPFNKPTLLTTINIAVKAFQKEIFYKNASEPFIMVESKNIKVKLLISEIFYIQSNANYLNVHTINEDYIVREKLKDFLDNLPSNKFIVQVHLRFAINKKHTSIINSGLVLVGNIKIPISKTYKNNLF